MSDVYFVGILSIVSLFVVIFAFGFWVSSTNAPLKSRFLTAWVSCGIGVVAFFTMPRIAQSSLFFFYLSMFVILALEVFGISSLVSGVLKFFRSGPEDFAQNLNKKGNNEKNNRKSDPLGIR